MIRVVKTALIGRSWHRFGIASGHPNSSRMELPVSWRTTPATSGCGGSPGLNHCLRETRQNMTAFIVGSSPCRCGKDGRAKSRTMRGPIRRLLELFLCYFCRVQGPPGLIRPVAGNGWHPMQPRCGPRPLDSFGPVEHEKIRVVVAADLARRSQASGLLVNHPEAAAILTYEPIEGARDGLTVAELLSFGTTVLFWKHVIRGHSGGDPRRSGQCDVSGRYQGRHSPQSTVHSHPIVNEA